MADTKAAAQRFIDALHALEQDAGDGAGAVDGLVALYADGAQLTNAAMALENESATGAEAIRTFWSDYKKTLGMIFSDFHAVTTGEDTAGLFWTTKSKDSDFAYDGATMLHFDADGKIDHFHGYYDTQIFNRQLSK